MHTIAEAVKDNRGNMRTEYVLPLHDILEVVIFSREPLTSQALSDLLDMDLDELDRYLSPLCSVLEVPDASDPDGVVRALHQSFPDFVRQKGGLVHPKLTIHGTVAEKHLTERCMSQLNKLLHMNICGLHNPSLFNDEIPDLEIVLTQYLTAALRYSCRFWITHWLEHIREAGAQAQVPDGLNQFCDKHLLHWIEVLSFTKSLPTVQRAIPDLMLEVEVRWLALCFTGFVLNSSHQKHPDWVGMELVRLLSDARFFMRDFNTPISLSALQVYHSGVVTMPECTLRDKIANISLPRLISEHDHGWQAAMSILYGHTERVTSVACSSGGSQIVSSSWDHTVRIWDAVTGTTQHTLKGHTGLVASVAFSFDGLRIVSGSQDHSVRVWDVVIGTTQHILNGHTGEVTSATFSSDGLRIVSGSYDETVRIWDAVSGTTQHTLEGHTDCVNSVDFSSDESRIVSGSKDRSVRVWDAVSGTIQHTLKGHTDEVAAVSSSSDGLRIVSGSYDETVRIWDAVLGTTQHTWEGHTDCVNSVDFSSDESRIVSGSTHHIFQDYHPSQSLSAFLNTSALRGGWCAFSLQSCHR
jgi:hypothetical protein